eukprot:SAG22_NODE_3_length_48349_cov_158.681180_36_plen_487_part_00
MLGGFDPFLHTAVGGLDSEVDGSSAGWENIVVRVSAAAVLQIQEASSEHETRFGKVRLGWRYAAASRQLTMKVSVPVGATAEVHSLAHLGAHALLKVEEASIRDPLWMSSSRRSSASVDDVHHVQRVEQKQGAVVAMVSSGDYLFTASYDSGEAASRPEDVSTMKPAVGRAAVATAEFGTDGTKQLAAAVGTSPCSTMAKTDLSCFWPLSNSTLIAICSKNPADKLCTTYCTEVAQVPAQSAADCCTMCTQPAWRARHVNGFAYNHEQKLCYLVAPGNAHRYAHLVNCSNAGGSHCSNDTSGFVTHAALKADDAPGTRHDAGPPKNGPIPQPAGFKHCWADPELARLPFCDPTLPPLVRARDLVSRLSLEEKYNQTTSNGPAVVRLGIDQYNYHSEGLHGLRTGCLDEPAVNTTLFPQTTGMAATGNLELIEEMGVVMGDEGRALNNIANGSTYSKGTGLDYWGPTMNIGAPPVTPDLRRTCRFCH